MTYLRSVDKFLLCPIMKSTLFLLCIICLIIFLQGQLWVWIPLMARRILYNIMWSNLSMTCSRSVFFSGYSCFLHQ